MNKKFEGDIRIWGRQPRQRFWQRCLDLLQHVCILSAFVLFLSYVQSVTAAESNQPRVVQCGPIED